MAPFLNTPTADPAVSGESPQPTASNGHATDSKNDLETMAGQVSYNAFVLSTFLQKQQLPLPSFERDAPTTVLPQSAPDEIKAARQALIEASLRLFQLATGPSEYMQNLAMGYNYLAALRWLSHFRIFSLVPLEGSISYSSLADAAKVSVGQLKTVTRMAMTSHLFCEPAPGEIAHTATSALLVTNPSFGDWASFMSEVSVPAFSRLVEASERWPGSTDKTQTSYNVAFNTDLPFFDHLATMPDKTKQFASYMKHVTQSEGTAIDHLLNGFDWASLGRATVVDVGGSTGNACISLARRFPDLDFIVQDLPENAAAGEAVIGEQGPEMTARVKFQGHDFFQPQPVHGARVYLLRMILHDWPKSEATNILKGLVPALTDGSRIVIMDSVLPAPGSLPSTLERQIRARDMTMMGVFNSLERDLDDWTDLLKAADQRLDITNVVQPVGSVMSVLEIKLNS